MELIVATQELAAPGGPQTYALTVAEHLTRLGHHVTVFARRLGAVGELARERRLHVTAQLGELPDHADGVLVGVDRSLAIELAELYPRAARVFVVHGIDEIHLPPPVDGVVAATVVLNDLFAARAEGCVGAGEVVRLRQPVDMRRFSSRTQPATRPKQALLLGNYHSGAGSRAQVLKDAWSEAELEWEHVGYPNALLEVGPAMYGVDLVVGYGRSIVEAMASGRPAYVYDHAGGDGWVTPDSYDRIEAAGFSGMSDLPPPDTRRLQADLAAYSPELGRLGYDLVRTHHDARQHAAQLVALLRRLSPEPPPLERSAMRVLTLVAEAQLRAEIERDNNRQEAKQWFARAQELNERLAEKTAEAAGASARLAAVQGTRRYRLAEGMARVAGVLRRARPTPSSRRGGGVS